MFDLEELVLLLVKDADEPDASWLTRWEQSYPMALSVSCAASQSIAEWQHTLNQALATLPENAKIMLVAHGSGCIATLAWLYQLDILSHRKLKGVLLVAPLKAAWQDDACHTLSRARLTAPAAVVCGQDDALSPETWAREMAKQLGAKYIRAPQSGHLNHGLFGWQWGMKLMQEMLLYPN